MPADTVAAAFDTAREVEADRRQRAVPVDVSDPDDLDELRLQLRDLLSAEAPHVRVWTWRAATSGGRALTALGADSGYELRRSYYRWARPAERRRFSEEGPRPVRRSVLPATRPLPPAASS